MKVGSENCENCGRIIGKLEAAHVVNEHVVCDECNERLRSKSAKELPYATAQLQQLPSDSRPVQIIEATAKSWKLIQAATVLGMAVAIGLMMAGFFARKEPTMALVVTGAAGFIVSALGYAVGRVGAWWYHG